jgi:hypothetical protein
MCGPTGRQRLRHLQTFLFHAAVCISQVMHSTWASPASLDWAHLAHHNHKTNQNDTKKNKYDRSSNESSTMCTVIQRGTTWVHDESMSALILYTCDLRLGGTSWTFASFCILWASPLLEEPSQAESCTCDAPVLVA